MNDMIVNILVILAQNTTNSNDPTTLTQDIPVQDAPVTNIVKQPTTVSRTVVNPPKVAKAATGRLTNTATNKTEEMKTNTTEPTGNATSTQTADASSPSSSILVPAVVSGVVVIGLFGAVIGYSRYGRNKLEI